MRNTYVQYMQYKVGGPAAMRVSTGVGRPE